MTHWKEFEREFKDSSLKPVDVNKKPYPELSQAALRFEEASVSRS